MPPKPRLIGLFVLLAVTAFVFRAVLFQGQTFSYRDTGHFYAPLWEYIQSQWSTGVPLWNPLENAGVPLAGTPTAAVFYPGKLIFLLPVSFQTAFEWFIVLHVMMSGATMYFLARRWKCSESASVLAGLSYAFCGNVVFQHCNVVFLCGAAWLPLAICTGERMIADCSRRHAVLHGLVLAMMVLAGDAQMAYLAGACTALYCLIRRLKDGPLSSQSLPRRLWTGPFSTLVFAATIAGLAAAVQILPTMEYSRLSVRAQSEVPRNIYGIPAFALRERPPEQRSDTGAPPNWYDAMVGNPPPPAKHDLAVFDFEVEPWRIVEFLYPGISGSAFCRWGMAIGIEVKSWTFTFYMGAIGCLLALSNLRWIRSDARTIWLTWIFTISLLGSFGTWTPWSLVRWIGGFGGGPTVDAVGGVYWLMQMLLPGFSEFRYPGKLLVPAAAALALLTARGWDRTLRSESPSLGKPAALIACGSLVLAGLTWLMWSYLDQQVDPIDRIHFDSTGARTEVISAFVHTAVVLGLFLIVLRWKNSLRGQATTVLILICGIDLAVAHRNMVETVPDDTASVPSRAVTQLKQRLVSEQPGSPPPRVLTVYDRAIGGLEPQKRLRVEREYLDGQFHLSDGVCSIPEHSTMQLNQLTAWFDFLPYPLDRDRIAILRARRALDAWGVDAFMLPPGGNRELDPNLSSLGLRTRWNEPRWSPEEPQFAPFGQPLDRVQVDGEIPVEVVVNDSAFPRTWIVHEVIAIPPIGDNERDHWLPLLKAMVFPRNHWIDLRNTAVAEDVELDESDRSHTLSTPPEHPEDEFVRLTKYTSQTVELECALNSIGLVILSDTWFPGWTAEVSADNGTTWETYPILRTNRMMRGVYLPAGRYRLRYEYRPASFAVGATLSATTWCVCLCLLAVAAWRRRTSGQVRPMRTALPGASEGP